MRKSTRIFILLAVFEVLLIAGTVFMVHQVTSGAWRTADTAFAIQRILTIMGSAIGGVGGVFLFLGCLLRWRGE